MGTANKKGGKKGRKYDRNKDWCNGYRLCNTELKNKLRAIRRHLKQPRHRNDKAGMLRYRDLGGKAF